MTPQALKASVLQLAIQGKLVPQRPEEGTAEELYQQIQSEKQALIANGTIKREKALPPIKEDEIPFDIPETWKWVRLGELGSYKKGPFGSALTKSMFVPKSNDTIKVYEQKNAIQKNANLGHYYIKREYFESSLKGFEVHPRDIIVSCAGTIGETFVLPAVIEKGIINQALMRISLYLQDISPYYLHYFDFELKRRAQKSSKGSAIKNIPPFEVLKNFLLPLPPLEEQKRITAKIEEILPLIDRYGEAYTELETFNKRFPDDLRKSILQEAIQGKLVPQLPEEGTAEELYQQIQAEKQRFITAGTIKKEKPLPPIEEKDLPFDIPETWKWVQLGEMVYNRGQKVPNAIFSYIDIGSIDNKQNKLNETENIIEASKAPCRARKIVDIGDILYATVRPYLHNICIIDRDFSAEPIASTGFAAMTCFNGVHNKYLFYYLLSPEFDKYANSTDNAKGMAYPAISDKRLYKAPIALPPLSEQKRIVAKIEEMLTHCKTLQ